MRGDSGGQINWGYQYNTSEFSVATSIPDVIVVLAISPCTISPPFMMKMITPLPA